MTEREIQRAVKWTREHFEKMNDRQFWIIPRSGMVLIKVAGGLLWCASIPPDDRSSEKTEHLNRQEEFAGLRVLFAELDTPIGKMEPIPEFDTIQEAMQAVRKYLENVELRHGI